MTLQLEIARLQERNDVLAFLLARQRMASTVAARNPEESGRAVDIARSIAIQIEMIEQGLHEGAADVALALDGAREGESSDG